MDSTKSIQVFGKVQGVWFRASTQKKALELGLVGFVQNRPDGSVYIEVEGEAAKVKQLVQWCHLGPKHARVGRVQVEGAEAKGYTDFQIIR